MMPAPLHIRAQLHPQGMVVRVLMPHANEGGRRRDAQGQLVPAGFIERIELHHNGELALALECGSTVSHNPFFQCVLLGAKAGDSVRVQWWDSLGETLEDRVLL